MVHRLCLALLALGATAAAGYTPTAAPFARKMGLSAARVAVAPVAMADEPSPKAVAVGAAWVGGLLAIQLTGELSNGILFAIAFAYGTTTASKFGDFTKVLGSTGSKVYSKSAELNDQYDILPKAKSAVDTAVVVAGNIDSNYGITKQLGVGKAYDKVEKYLTEVKDGVTAKVDDLKAKASSS